MRRWVYMTSPIAMAADADALGAQGWELCGFHGGKAWFKRDRIAHELARQGEQHARERAVDDRHANGR